MLVDHMFRQEIAGLEFLITVIAFPKLSLVIFTHIIGLPYIVLHLISQNSHIIWDLATFRNPGFRFIFYLFKALVAFTTAIFNPQKGRSNF